MTYSHSFFFSFFFILAFSAGCNSNSRNANKRVEQPIAVSTPAPSDPTATPFPRMPSPSASEVRVAMRRVFSDVLVLTNEPGNFIVGDFNGDGAEDLAVIARPAAGKLKDVNSEVANWVIQDADHLFIRPPTQRVVRLAKEEPPKVVAGETIVAVIHGFGPSGWRNPQARQGYLLKHAAAAFEGIAPSISQKSIRAMHLPVETDIINSVRNNKKGFVFWTGGMYAWHSRAGRRFF